MLATPLAGIIRNIPDQLKIFSYYSGILYKTLELLICNHLIIHFWSFYKNTLFSIFFIEKYAKMQCWERVLVLSTRVQVQVL